MPWSLGYTSPWHHTLSSMSQASQHKLTSLPLRRKVCIWRRNSKSLDANQMGMGECRGFQFILIMKFLQIVVWVTQYFHVRLSKMEMYEHFVKGFEFHLGFGSVLPAWVLAQCCLYLLQVFHTCFAESYKSQCRYKSRLGMRRQHLRVPWSRR